MAKSSKPADQVSSAQSARFIEAARKLGTDEDPERFKETVRNLAKAPPSKQADKPTKAIRK